MKKAITITVDEELLKLVAHKGNLSRYFNGLLKQDVFEQHVDKLAERTAQELLKNAEFITAVRSAAKQTKGDYWGA
mgnify:FL=1